MRPLPQIWRPFTDQFRVYIRVRAACARSSSVNYIYVPFTGQHICMHRLPKKCDGPKWPPAFYTSIIVAPTPAILGHPCSTSRPQAYGLDSLARNFPRPRTITTVWPSKLPQAPTPAPSSPSLSTMPSVSLPSHTFHFQHAHYVYSSPPPFPQVRQFCR